MPRNCSDLSGDASAAQLSSSTEAAVAHWIEQARGILGLTPRQLPLPELRFNLRGRAAGQALLSRRRGQADAIRINADLLASHPRNMIDETVPHEVAHVAIHRRYNQGGRRVRPHGPEWKALMQAFGVTDETCHNLPVTPARQLRRFRYACGCDEPAWLTSIRHRRAQNGTVYRCRRCGQPLAFAADGRIDGD